MEYNLDNIKDLVTIAKPFIDPIVSTIIKPQIDKLGKWVKRQEVKGQADESWFENKFEEYLARTYNYCQNINILIFQNQQVKIKDIYFPLTITSNKDEKTYQIDNFTLEHIKPYQRMLISDTAGMGKSTMMKWIGTKIIENSLGVPILIELRNLKENHTVLDEIYTQINPIDNSFDKDLILRFLEIGHFIILLDGFDEIQLKNQEIIIKDLRTFINKTPNNYFVLTSRPEGALASFGDFQMFNIKPLKESESFQLIEKYDSICPIKIGQNLIRDIKHNFNQTKELLGNPFLVSLIYSTYTYNKDIPSNKVTFYEEIYSALFKRHDLSKDGWTRTKKSKLDIQQFKKILRQLAFDTAIIGTIVYSESEILQYVNNAAQKCPGIEFNTVDFLDDLLSSVPLFQRDGSKIKWAHKSLQDYFAADFIAFDSRKEEIINRIYKSEKDGFLNILELFFELDYKTFRNTIIKSLLTKFMKHCSTTYNHDYEISKEVINERRSQTFDNDIILFKALKDDDFNDGKKIFDFIEEQLPDIDLQDKSVMILWDSRIMVMSEQKYSTRIIKLLGSKQLSFVEHLDFSNIKFKVNFKSSKFLTINDDPKSTLNSKTNFKKTNTIITHVIQGRNSGGFVLNVEKATKELETINNEIRRELSTDNFNDI